MRTRAARQVHPFPARMAPELAMEALDRLPSDSVVLDPMCGSGTVLREAAERGHRAIGFDLDPLAVLMSRVACRRVTVDRVRKEAERLVNLAPHRSTKLPWVDRDPDSLDFLDYWFAPEQLDQLRRIARQLARRSQGPVTDVLRLALSRTIITKDHGASLARDVSHSRPHRVADENDYDVYGGFLTAVGRITDLVDRPVRGRTSVQRGDARRLPDRLDGTVDLLMTSPPYLNAIDYMRGHKMSLIWLGHQLAELRALRSNAVGAERSLPQVGAEPLIAKHSAGKLIAPRYKNLSPKQQGMLDRYANDMCQFATHVERKLSPSGEAVIVIGDCSIRGVYVKNSLVVERAAERAGLRVIDRRSRRLPPASRYLPPPSSETGPLSKRLKSEIVLRLRRA